MLSSNTEQSNCYGSLSGYVLDSVQDRPSQDPDPKSQTASFEPLSPVSLPGRAVILPRGVVLRVEFCPPLKDTRWSPCL